MTSYGAERLANITLGSLQPESRAQYLNVLLDNAMAKISNEVAIYANALDDLGLFKRTKGIYVGEREAELPLMKFDLPQGFKTDGTLFFSLDGHIYCIETARTENNGEVIRRFNELIDRVRNPLNVMGYSTEVLKIIKTIFDNAKIEQIPPHETDEPLGF